MKLTNDFKRHLKKLVVGTFLTGLVISLAYAAQNSGPISASDQQVQATDLVGKHGQQKVDLFTGSFGYSVPINCPPARNGSEPGLALDYSSSGDDGWCGMGWELAIGSIERNVRDGFPIAYSSGNPSSPLNQYDDTKGFMLNLFGKADKIFSVATNGAVVEYRAETDTDFMRCFFNTNNNTWTVYDKSGTAYYFGETSASRVANPKTGWSGASGTFHWALDQIITATGDWTTIAYTTYTSPYTAIAERTLYPTQIAYNGHTNVNSYSANFTPTHTINFYTEVRTNDWRFSFRSGFRMEMNRRLTNIVCAVGSQNVWSYSLKYGVSPATARSLLTNVVIYGFNGSTATPYLTNSFAYQANPNGVSFGSTIAWTNLVLSAPGGGYDPGITVAANNYSVADLLDIDGDGLPDRVVYNDTVTPNQYLVQKNTGGGFGTQYGFGPTSTGLGTTASASNPFPDGNPTYGGSAYAELNTPYGRIRDLNGDGLPDRLVDYWTTPYTNFAIAFNMGTNFSSPTRWAVTNVPFATDPDAAYQLYASVEGLSTYSFGTSTIDVGIGLWDINGDLLPDRVMTGFASYGGMTNLYVQDNTGSGFTPQLRLYPYKSQNMTGVDAQTVSHFAAFETPDSHFIDMNGDGLPDHLMWPAIPSNPGGGEASHPVSFFAVEYNDGYSFESTNTVTTAPGAYDVWPGVVAQTTNAVVSYNGATYYSDAMMEPPIAGLFDLNGDGLPDRVVVDQTSLGTATTRWFVYLNNGHGFNTNPITLTNIENEGQYQTFSGTTEDPYWSPQGSANPSGVNAGSEVSTLIDINGDGLLDRVLAVYWNPSVSPFTPTANYFLVQLNQGPFPDLLTNVNNGIGGNTAVTYKSSTAYDNRVDPTNPNSGSRLPFPRQVVSSVAESDGINSAQTTTYGYAGGYYDGPRREFHGFGVVTNIDPTLRTTVTYFHTGGGRNYAALGEYQDTNSTTGLGNFAKSGMAYRVETYGNDNELYHVQINQIDQTSLGNARYFPFTTLSFDCDYPGNGTPKVTATDFAYDNTTGNLTNKVEYGLVNSFNPTSVGSFTFTDADSTDNHIYKTTYAAISGNTYIVDHAATDILADNNNNTVHETDYAYNSSSGTIATKLTRISASYFATNSYGSYTTYGMVGLTTDPVGVQTEIAYDSTYNQYPATTRIRVAPGSDSGGDFITTDTYDARSGNLSSSTDPAGLTVTNNFDSFLRPTETDKIPIGGGSPIWVKKYDYPSVLLPIVSGVAVNYVDVVDNDGVGGHTNRTYIDGFVRTIQTLAQGEANNFRVISTAYDGRGEAFLTTWPIFASSISFTKPTSGLTASWIGYDADGRVATNRAVNVTFSNGAFSSKTDLTGDTGSPLAAKTWSYVNGTDPWWVICTDEDGQIRRYGLDAFDRTNQIQEVDGSNIYTNLLRYDLADNLTNLVNANGENIYWAFDDDNNTVAMADPYLGQWTYQRDYAGRVRVQTDARSNVVSNSYINPSTGYQDVMGRLQVQTVYSFNYTNSTLVPAYTNAYVYDTSDDGNYTVYKGLLYKTVDSQGYEKNGYDPRTRTIKTTRYLNINAASYTTTNGYDDGDNVTAIGYPNGGPTVNYSYYHGKSINQVSRGGSSYNFYSVGSGSYYDEFEHVTNFTYGSTLATTRSYYSTSKRLQSISAGSGGTVFNRTFTYTAGDDIASLLGTGISGTASVTYYNLHRIKTYTGLTGSYGYDAVGNITNNIEGGGSAYGYGVRRPQAVKAAYGATNLYDLCGNMIVRHTNATNSEALVYDAENQLVRVATVGTNFVLAKFGYADDGSRLWKWSNATTNELQVWIGNIYEEKGGKVLYHVFAGGEQVCTFEATSPLNGGVNSSAVGYYYHQDNLNSSSALSDSSKTQQEVDAYYPFGRQIAGTLQASFQVSRRFTGQEFDAETGLYYYGDKGGRYYDVSLGRFIQADNIISDLSNPQSWNRYSYCLNDPLILTDPTGHSSDDNDDDPTDHLSLTLGGNHAMLRQQAGGASAQLYNQSGSNLRTVATVGRTVAEMNPIVGAANGAIGAATGKDAVTGAPLTGGERVLAGVGGMASIIPGEGAEIKAGGAVLKDAKEGVYSFKEGEATYVGQSGDIAKRLRAHELSGKKAPGIEATTTEVSGGKTAREIAEHKQIQEITGGVPASESPKVTNQRDPIGPNRQQLLKDNP
jgi:RHS repeat-associated protein